MTDDTFLALVRAVHDQARESIRRFVERNHDELGGLLDRYKEDSESGDEKRVLDSLLAAYGLVTAILDADGAGVPIK